MVSSGSVPDIVTQGWVLVWTFVHLISYGSGMTNYNKSLTSESVPPDVLKLIRNMPHFYTNFYTIGALAANFLIAFRVVMYNVYCEIFAAAIRFVIGIIAMSFLCRALYFRVVFSQTPFKHPRIWIIVIRMIWVIGVAIHGGLAVNALRFENPDELCVYPFADILVNGLYITYVIFGVLALICYAHLVRRYTLLFVDAASQMLFFLVFVGAAYGAANYSQEATLVGGDTTQALLGFFFTNTMSTPNFTSFQIDWDWWAPKIARVFPCIKPERAYTIVRRGGTNDDENHAFMPEEEDDEENILNTLTSDQRVYPLSLLDGSIGFEMSTITRGGFVPQEEIRDIKFDDMEPINFSNMDLNVNNLILMLTLSNGFSEKAVNAKLTLPVLLTRLGLEIIHNPSSWVSHKSSFVTKMAQIEHDLPLGMVKTVTKIRNARNDTDVHDAMRLFVPAMARIIVFILLKTKTQKDK